MTPTLPSLPGTENVACDWCVTVVVVVVVVLSNVDVGDPRCPIHGEDAIFTHKL